MVSAGLFLWEFLVGGTDLMGTVLPSIEGRRTVEVLSPRVDALIALATPPLAAAPAAVAAPASVWVYFGSWRMCLQSIKQGGTI